LCSREINHAYQMALRCDYKKIVLLPEETLEAANIIYICSPTNIVSSRSQASLKRVAIGAIGDDIVDHIVFQCAAAWSTSTGVIDDTM
jgi:hypothetical protein